MISDRALGKPRNRADQLRSRRARVSRQIDVPKPVKRSKPRRTKKPRRRVDLSLAPEQGLEMRLPALPVLHVGVRPLSALCIALLLLMTRSALIGSGFKVQEIEISGARLLSEVQVRSVAGVMENSAFMVNPEEVEARLEAYPEIKAAEVEMGWPNIVRIKLSERRPAVVWDDGGRSWWLSRDGVALIRREAETGLVNIVSPEPILRITRDTDQPVVDPEVLSAAISLSGQFPNAFFFTFDSEHGLGFQDPRGWQAFFGHQGDMDLKVRIYESIAERLVPKGIQIEFIDVTNPSMPYYRLQR
jgi:cell division protein FtsQ